MKPFLHVGPIRRTRCKGWGYDLYDARKGLRRYAYGSPEVAKRELDLLLKGVRAMKAGFVTYSSGKAFDRVVRTMTASPTRSTAYG